MGWVVVLTTLNRFAGDYVGGLLLLYAVLTAVVGLGARSIRPVLWFLGFGLPRAAVGTGTAPARHTTPLILLPCMTTIALLEGIAIQAHISTRKELREREERLRSIAENVSDGIYRSTPEAGLAYANQAFAEMFGYERPEEVLRVDRATMYADPDEREQLREKAKREGSFGPTELERRDASSPSG